MKNKISIKRPKKVRSTKPFTAPLPKEKKETKGITLDNDILE